MKPLTSYALAIGAFTTLGVVAAFAPRHPAPPSHADMRDAAAALINAVPEQDRAKLRLPFDDPARTDWHFVPRSRPGLTLGDMTDAQRALARALLRTALSSQGMLKVEQIMSLENVLRDMEHSPARDYLKYTFTIYGDPGAAAPWAWKIEGHHICLNFTCVGDSLSANTPSFLGANPAEVKSGPMAGLRVLSVEEDLARELLRSLDDAQRADAVIAEKAPADILLVPGRGFDDAPAQGVAYARLHPAQRVMLDALLEEYARTLRREIAEGELARIRSSGIDSVRFAWAGPAEPGQGHYYRISGPTFVIEYDNTQGNANHVHTVWRDRTRDFGADALREHYQHDHAK
jgi:hypothetical protein